MLSTVRGWLSDAKAYTASLSNFEQYETHQNEARGEATCTAGQKEIHQLASVAVCSARRLVYSHIIRAIIEVKSGRTSAYTGSVYCKCTVPETRVRVKTTDDEQEAVNRIPETKQAVSERSNDDNQPTKHKRYSSLRCTIDSIDQV